MKNYTIIIAMILLSFNVQGMPSVNIEEEIKKLSIELTRLTDEESNIKTEREFSIVQRDFNILKGHYAVLDQYIKKQKK